jgi:hypothetical protein
MLIVFWNTSAFQRNVVSVHVDVLFIFLFCINRKSSETGIKMKSARYFCYLQCLVNKLSFRFSDAACVVHSNTIGILNVYVVAVHGIDDLEYLNTTRPKQNTHNHLMLPMSEVRVPPQSLNRIPTLI